METGDQLTGGSQSKSANHISRVAARITACGAVVVLASFLGALWQLRKVEVQLAAKRTELRESEAKITELRAQSTQLSNEVNTLKTQVGHFKHLTQDLNNAIKFQTDRDYTGSAEALAKIVQSDPNNEVALYWLARAYSKLGRYDEALRVASNALAIDSSYIDPYVVIIYSLHRTGQQSKAVACLRSALNMSIEVYPYFTSRTRDLDALWNLKPYRDVFLEYERQITNIQGLLLQRHLYSGKADGFVGSRTRAAIAQFYSIEKITNSPPLNILAAKLQLHH